MFYAKYRKIKFTKIGFPWKEFLVPINTFFSFDFGKMSHLGGHQIQKAIILAFPIPSWQNSTSVFGQLVHPH